MFSKFFINRPIFATVVSILIIIAGIVSVTSLPVKEYPAVVPPQIMVSTSYPGADAKTLLKTVSVPLEESINGVKNMTYMSATASPSGELSLSVFFDTGTDVDQAKVDVNNKVQLAMSRLPAEVRRQGVSVVERSPDFLKVIAFTSKNQVHDSLFISNYLSINVIDDLKRIKGVGDAMIFGQKNYAMQVWIDPGKLKFYNLSTNDILNIIKEQNEQYSAGAIASTPIEEVKPFTYNVTTKGRFTTKEQFEDIIVRSNPDGSTLVLKNVARIELASERYITTGKYNTQDMMPVGIFLSPGANALEVSDEVNQTLSALSKKFPSDLTYETPYDSTIFVKESINEVVHTLIEAVIFVIILIYLFLGNFRATIIPVLAIPVSIIGTFAFLYLAGFSINLLTLFGLILAIGLVVDDAIIVIENVERILRTTKGISVKDATIEAMKELTTPVVAIVLVLSAVFIPAAFTGGFSGVMYKQFAITIVISVIISGIVALTLTPALCAIFLKEHEPEPFWFIKKFNQFFDWLTDLFVIFTKQTIRLWVFSLILIFGLIFATYSLIGKIPTGLVPSEDKGVLMVLNYMMPATSLGESSQITEDIEKKILKNENVEATAAITGIDIVTFAYKTDASIIFAKLKPWEERKKEEQSSQNLAGKLLKDFSQNKDAMVIPLNPPPIMGMSATGGFELWIQDRTGKDIHVLNTYIQQIVQKAKTDPRLTMVRSTLNTNVPQYVLEVDRKKAKALNVSVHEIFTTIQSTFGKSYINDFSMFSKTFHVNLQNEAAYRASKDNYKDLFVKSTKGDFVPVSELIHIKRVVDLSVGQRFNMFNAAQITGSPNKGYASSDAMTAIEEISNEILPNGYTTSWAGTSYQEKKLQDEGNYTSIYAALFVFLILAALYESWSIPLAVILSIPFAIFGAAVAVLLRGLEADIYFQVGIITLIGLSAKNAILIVEFAIDKLKDGLPLLDATIEAARLRFRPIVMTSLAFIVGTLPLALSTGAGANSRHIIGTTVVGGMVSATVIGVLFIPLFFYLILKVKEKLTKKRESK